MVAAAPINPKTKYNETEAHQVYPTEYNNSNSAPKTNVTTRTACIKNTYPRDSVLLNETDEPKMTKAQCNLRRRCGSLQRVRDGERGVVEQAVVVVLLLQANHAEAEG